ncbi:uroporphyrinogen decarboxylase [Actinomyces wuliandei]|uniref:uroporphyrinogen decarboxylase n=1 Tax=Actinomyces wuliandei TaxID=2057743 RepID=UPI000FDA0B0D|nr:uroporphyrinogen decarboxylase [Actinomyces wuliandei]
MPRPVASTHLPALLEALDGRRPQRTPVWFMRQAGRSLPEYRQLRARAGAPMLDACLDPSLAAEATLQPVRRHGVDAAVLFSDIVLPLRLAGVAVRIEEGVGPVLDHPVREARDVTALLEHHYGDARAGAGAQEGASGAEAVAEAVRRVVAELGSPQAPGRQAALGHRARAGLRHSHGQAAWTPLIGFGGGPFTLAAYMVEGRPSRDHLAARTLMHADPTSWDRLMTWCARLTGAFIATQVAAGACVAQLFDSWAGALSPTLYRQHVLPYSRLALETASQAVSPVTGRPPHLLHFGTGTARLLGDMRAAGAHAVGVDERTDLGEAVETLSRSDPQGRPCPVQGNLDPALLAAPWPVLARAVDTCLEAGLAAPAHVVNLGHGVPPSTDPDTLTRVVARVHGSTDWEETALEGWQPAQEQS